MIAIDFERLRQLINSYEKMLHAENNNLKTAVYFGTFAAELDRYSERLKNESTQIINNYVAQKREEDAISSK